MTDSNLLRLMESPAAGRWGLVTAAEMDAAPRQSARSCGNWRRTAALRGADTLNERHLLTR